MSNSFKTYLDREESGKMYFKLPDSFVIDILKKNKELEEYLVNKVLDKFKDRNSCIEVIQNNLNEIDYLNTLKTVPMEKIRILKKEIKDNLSCLQI